jgi:hypothetical protein
MTEVKMLTDDEQVLFEKVAEVCGLELAVPDRYLIDDSPVQDVLQELRDLGAEALGTYDPIISEVRLFVKRCAQAAKEFKVRPRDVEVIVLAHEWAHLIQHQGKGKHPDAPVAWKDYPRLWQYSETDEEDLAEKAAFMALHKLPDGNRLQHLMIRLAEVSPPKYQKWLTDYANWRDAGSPPIAALQWLHTTLRLVRDVDLGRAHEHLKNHDS